MFTTAVNGRWRILTPYALHPRLLPLPVLQAANHRQVALYKAGFTLVTDHRVDLVAVPPLPECGGVFHLGRGAAKGWWGWEERRGVSVRREAARWRQRLRAAQRPLTGTSLACERQVVVAGHVVPLAVFMPDHHHAVLPRVKVIVRLV